MTKAKLHFILAVIAWVLAIACVLAYEFKWLPEHYEAPEPELEPVEEELPVVQLISYVPPTSDKPDLAKLKQIENATLTHYCVCKVCCGKTPEHPAYGVTVSGREAEPYLSVAVDPYVIPLGSTVYVDYGDENLVKYRADDTGSGVAGAHIDLCVTNHQEALNLGVKTVRVFWEEG